MFSIRSFLIACAVALVVVASAAAAWGGKDPASNTPIGRLPRSCSREPTGPKCINVAVYYLDKARKRSGLPPYALPANFPSLKPTRQLFILVNLDRVQYGLPPITGMTSELNHAALTSGVLVADDPHPSDTTGLTTVWPGWAGEFRNAPFAYEAWVWDDGIGSNNPRCTSTDHSRCWGHRHSVLWKFGGGSILAMGVAAGRDSSRHQLGYAYIFVGGSSAYKPEYTYTWKQAVADGAGTNVYDYGAPPRAQCEVPAVVGKALAGASRAIEDAHCSVGKLLHKHSYYEAGVVTQQHPEPGLRLAPGAKIRLTVSRGPR
jgi:hypothetical protein